MVLMGQVMMEIQILIPICDNCIDSNLEDGTMLMWGNFISSQSTHLEDSIEKSKMLYRRRKNLDNLT
jgi:hypothetical protein